MSIWTPDNHTDLSLWMDAKDTGTIAIGADWWDGRIVSWADKSPFAKVFTQVTDNSRPQYLPGIEGVTFSAASNTDVNQTQMLRHNSMVLQGFPFMCFVAYSNNNNTGCILGSEAGNREYHLAYANQTHSRNTATVNAVGPSYDDTNPHIQTVGCLWRSRTSRHIYINGAHDGEVTTDLADIVATGNTFIGNRRVPNSTWGSNPFTGVVHEIVCFSIEPDAADIDRVFGYLHHRWKAQHLLADDHAYRYAPDGGVLFTGNANFGVRPAKLVVGYDRQLNPAPASTPDPVSEPIGAYTAGVSEKQPMFLQSHAFEPEKWRGLWLANTAYAAGDIVFSEGSDQAQVVECTTGGVSDATPPTWNQTLEGTTSDNTVIWVTLGNVSDLAPRTNFYVPD